LEVAPTRLSEQIGRVVGGRYRLVAALGAGASAQVFLADDVRLERQVAVKMLQPVLADDERFLRRFRAEARTVAAINHPNVVVVHDWGEDDVPYLVTEYLAGGSLRAMLHGGRTLAPSQALVVALDVCRGLAHAHASGLVHRDLKPANVLFDTSGRLRIADFGLARAIAEASVTEPEGAVVGTARYAAPEQARGERLDGRSDVYALALLVVEAVTGAVPFASDTTLGTLMARIERDLEVPPELGPLKPAIERAGRLDPEDRPDAEELGIMLLAASERMNAPAPLPLVGALEEARLGAPDELTRTDMVPLPLLDPTAVGDPSPPGHDSTTVAAAPPRPPGDADEAAARRRRWPLVLAALVLVALGAGAFFAVETLRTPSHEVPELVGTQIDELELVAAQNDWVLDRKKTRRDGTEPGEIVSTDPAAGEELDEGGTLVVVVSEGNELTAVPTGLEGRPLPEVAAELEAAGLAHAVAQRVHHEEIPLDAVVAVEGEVPAELPRGTALPLVVSDGPEPRTVPEFRVGASYNVVAAELRDNRLVPVRVNEFSDDVPLGGVISLSEEPGTQVPRDSEITVVVSKGPDLVAVPDVRGRTLAQAEAALEEAGLVLGQDCCNSKGKVVTTDPAPGTKVRRGTEVNVFLAR
jgi:beta-lactam-binding protein with PASTA domain/tRNA A-37 threonylcarbamoyl transferase component Bud32